MIIACSANALTRIRQACFNRAAKADGRPLLVDAKTQLAKVRSAIAANPDAAALVWNLDFAEAPIVNGHETVGTVLTGYLYQREAQFTVVLNSLDDGDLCRIGTVAHNALRIAMADSYICPGTTEGYLNCADSLAEQVAESCGMRFLYPYEAAADKTILIANADRGAASGLTRARTYHETFLYGESGAHVSHEPVDRYACYRLNERSVEFKQADGTKRRNHPFLKMRDTAVRFANDNPVAAVELKLTLIDDAFLYRNYHDRIVDDVPECWRTVLVPLDAPLSWVHRVIQKAFNWYDYHLHRFTYLDFDVREAFDDLFSVECGIERFGEDPLAIRQAAYDAANGHERFKQLTGLDEKWLLRTFAPYAEKEFIHEDLPQAELPDGMPVGLALFGSARYEGVMGIEHLERDLDRRNMLRNYYASLRQATAKKAAKARGNDNGAGETEKAAGDTTGIGAETPDLSMALATLSPNEANALFYNYDFGDDWGVSIEVLSVRQEPLSSMPRVLDGAGHTPPEDCGGIGGFKDVIAAYELVGDGHGDKATRTKSSNTQGGSNGIDDDGLAEAQDLLSWAKGVVGWRPFKGADGLAETFNRPGRM